MAELEAVVGQKVTLTATHDGGAPDVTWSWTKPAGSAAPSSITNVLEWNFAATDEGDYTAQAASTTAPDTPQSDVITVTLPVPKDPDAEAILAEVVASGGTVERGVRIAYTSHVIRLKEKGLWAGGDSDGVFWYLSGVSGASRLAPQSAWGKGGAPVFSNFTDGDHDTLDGIKGDRVGKAATWPNFNLDGIGTWMLFANLEGDGGAGNNMIGYAEPVAFGNEEAFQVASVSGSNSVLRVRKNNGAMYEGPTVPSTGLWGLGVSAFNVSEFIATNGTDPSITEVSSKAVSQPAYGMGVWRLDPEGQSLFSGARIFLIWCRPNTLTPFTEQQMIDMIAEVKQYHSELQAALTRLA
jgi:hypothetical protein